MKYGDKPMRILLPFLMVGFSAIVNAAPPVTHQFTNGTTIEASQVNANYQELADRIEVSDNILTVTTNSSEIAVLQGQIIGLQNQLTSLQNVSQKQLIGFTTADVVSRNPLRMTAQCQAEFTGSRVCTVREIIETVNLPILPENVTARVAPSLGMDSQDLSSSFYSLYLGNGVNASSISCLYYTTGSATIDNSTPFGASCNVGFKVACCR